MQTVKYSSLHQTSLFDTGELLDRERIMIFFLQMWKNVGGPAIWSIPEGRLGPLERDTVVIPDMNETLLSEFQISNGGSMSFQCIAVFTAEGCRIFKLDSVRDALVTMHDTGTENMRGLWHHGLYDEDKEFVKRTDLKKMFVTHTKSISL